VLKIHEKFSESQGFDSVPNTNQAARTKQAACTRVSMDCSVKSGTEDEDAAAKVILDRPPGIVKLLYNIVFHHLPRDRRYLWSK
jgi:hypothetical protein